MVTFPNAKINIGLHILKKREDGFHNISTCMYPVYFLTDILEIILSNTINFTSSGIIIDTENLCVKAYNFLKKKKKISNIHLHLHKIINIGGGLGGGSSDAAFVLKMLNDLFFLHLTNLELEEYAGELGSDVPFFINNRPSFAEGKGNLLTESDISLRGYFLLLVFPNIFISTKEAYSHIIPDNNRKPIEQILSLPMREWKKYLENDFEKNAFKTYPLLKEIKETLYQNGALYASMSGSGSTLYGIFEKEPPQIFENNNLHTKGQYIS